MNEPRCKHEKFTAYFGQKNDYLFFVGIRINDALRWHQVYQIDGDDLIGLDFQRYRLGDLKSWLVAYPRTGEIVDGEQIFDPLPNGITGDMHKSPIEIPEFTLADLVRGQKLVEINFSPSPTHPNDSCYYSTRLTNQSDKKLKCLMFGAYTYPKRTFKLSTVTGRPFTASQFTEWYAVDTHGWLGPGDAACDPTNYGSNCFWVYYFQTELNEFFHVGLEVGGRKNLISRLFRL